MIALLVLVGCGEDDGQGDLAPVVQDDVEQLARVMEDVALSPISQSDCIGGPGTCDLCYEATGTPLAGTLTVGLDSTPCSVTYAGERGDLTWTAESSAFVGSWEGDATGVSLELSGQQTASWAGSGGRLGGGPTVFQLDEALLEATLAGEVTGFSLEGAYTTARGRTYQVSVAEAGGSLAGTLTAPNGGVCGVSGTREAPVVDCSR